jgi:hypothetical protein
LNQTFIAQFCGVDQTNFNFILKYDYANILGNEKFCSRILHHLGLITPTIKIIKNGKGSDIIAKFQHEMQNISPEEDDQLLFMPAFQAETVNSLIINKKIAEIGVEDFQFLLKLFGEMAVYDLLIGNNDRFFHLKPGDKILFSDPFFNSGNVMLATPLPKQGGNLQLFAIDNGSSQQLQAQKKDTPSELYQKFRRAFCYVVGEGHFLEFAQHILKGVMERLRKGDPKNLPPQLEAEKLINQGIQSGIDRLRQIDLDLFSQSAKTPLALTTLHLIKENLSSIGLKN